MFQQISQKIKTEKEEHELIPRIHHILMKEYGWIPLNEFKNLPIPTVFSLMEQIRQDREEEKKAYEKSKKGRR